MRRVLFLIPLITFSFLCAGLLAGCGKISGSVSKIASPPNAPALPPILQAEGGSELVSGAVSQTTFNGYKVSTTVGVMNSHIVSSTTPNAYKVYHGAQGIALSLTQ